MSEENKLIVVSWINRPFMITYAMIGTKEEIYSEAIRREDCTYKCKEASFRTCVEDAFDFERVKTFTDKWHGLLVCPAYKFEYLDEARDYVQNRYGELIH